MAKLQPNYIPPEELSEDANDHVRVTLQQGPVLEGRGLIAALRRLVEIGRRLERQAREQ